MNEKQRKRFAAILARYAKAWHERRMKGGSCPDTWPYTDQEFEEACDGLYECVKELMKEGVQPEPEKKPRKAKAK